MSFVFKFKKLKLPHFVIPRARSTPRDETSCLPTTNQLYETEFKPLKAMFNFANSAINYQNTKANEDQNSPRKDETNFWNRLRPITYLYLVSTFLIVSLWLDSKRIKSELKIVRANNKLNKAKVTFLRMENRLQREVMKKLAKKYGIFENNAAGVVKLNEIGEKHKSLSC